MPRAEGRATPRVSLSLLPAQQGAETKNPKMTQSSDQSSPDLATTEVMDVNVNVEPSLGITTWSLSKCGITGRDTSVGPAFFKSGMLKKQKQ